MYSAEISRNNPTAFLFLIDQSGSMDSKNEFGKTLAELVSDSINKLFNDLMIKCSKSEGVRNYFDVGVIAYGNNKCSNGLKGALASSILNPISAIEENPLRIEDRIKKVSDGAGGVIEQRIKFPVWFEPVADGGTPMYQALKQAAVELVTWCDNHPDSFPPIVINITDGENTDPEDPEEIADKLKQIGTNDGEVLLFNVHITQQSSQQFLYVDSESQLPNASAKKMFRMSSTLTESMQKLAENAGYTASANSRGYCYNAEIVSLIDFLEIGTRAANLR